jgi:DNA-binding transcriptional LysR family regulator
MRLSYFEEFIELSRTLNFNEAARNLHLSQSTLSKHIQSLEENLQAKLFERDRHHVVLSSQGEVFLECATSICKDYQELKETFIADAQNRFQLFIGGLVDSPGEFAWLSSASYKLQYKELLFSPHFIPVGAVSPITQVINGSIDCALISYDPEDYDKQIVDRLTSIQVAQSPFVIVVSSKNPLAAKAKLRVQDMQNQTFIRMMGPRSTSGWSVIDKLFKRHRIAYKTKQVTLHSVYDYIGINLDQELLILPQCETRKHETKSTNRRTLLLDAENAVFDINVVYRNDNSSDILQAYIKELQDTPL